MSLFQTDKNLLLQGSICRDAFLGRSPRTWALNYKALQLQISLVSFRLVPLKHPHTPGKNHVGKKMPLFLSLDASFAQEIIFLLNFTKITWGNDDYDFLIIHMDH